MTQVQGNWSKDSGFYAWRWNAHLPAASQIHGFIGCQPVGFFFFNWRWNDIYDYNENGECWWNNNRKMEEPEKKTRTPDVVITSTTLPAAGFELWTADVISQLSSDRAAGTDFFRSRSLIDYVIHINVFSSQRVPKFFPRYSLFQMGFYSEINIVF